MKERPNAGELLSKPCADSAGVESALLGLLEGSRRRSGIATAGTMCKAVWGPLLLLTLLAVLPGENCFSLRSFLTEWQLRV